MNVTGQVFRTFLQDGDEVNLLGVAREVEPPGKLWRLQGHDIARP